jgi:hypothetical protein
MPVTELALLHLPSKNSIDSATLRSKLTHAKTVMQTYTGRSFYFLQQVEDPSLIYIIGEWDSLAQHMEHFIPGKENQAVLESLKDDVTVEWLLHIDVPHAGLPLPKDDSSTSKALSGKLVWSIVRHFIRDGERGKFQNAFDDNKQYLQDFVTEGQIGGGWRVDRDEEKEEWVLFCPWTGVEQHSEFARTDGFGKYGGIREYIAGAEIKHARLLDL